MFLKIRELLSNLKGLITDKDYCAYCGTELFPGEICEVPDFKNGGSKRVCKYCKVFFYYKYGGYSLK